MRFLEAFLNHQKEPLAGPSTALLQLSWIYRCPSRLSDSPGWSNQNMHIHTCRLPSMNEGVISVILTANPSRINAAQSSLPKRTIGEKAYHAPISNGRKDSVALGSDGTLKVWFSLFFSFQGQLVHKPPPLVPHLSIAQKRCGDEACARDVRGSKPSFRLCNSHELIWPPGR